MTASQIATKSCHLCVYDKRSYLKFLIDFGSDVSCIPPPKNLKKLFKAALKLFAANNTSILTYDSKLLNSGLRHSFEWKFLVANVPMPLIGADFLENFALIIDLKHHKTIDSTTKLSQIGKFVKYTQNSSIKLISGYSEYHKIIYEFPNLTNINPKHGPVLYNAVYFIETSASN